MIRTEYGTEMSAAYLSDPSFEELITMRHALDFALRAAKPAYINGDRAALSRARHIVRDMIFPLCADEDREEGVRKARLEWAALCDTAGGIVTEAVVLFSCQDPEQFVAQEDGIYEHLAPFVKSARYMIAYPHARQDVLI